jgi:N4-gp56 family major capsid protein
MYFTQLSSTTNMPKHMGKTIKKYHYLPLLDDANINDQGIDAAGVSTTLRKTIIIRKPGTVKNIYTDYYATGEGANSGAATTAAEAKALTMFRDIAGLDITNALYDTYAEAKAYLEGLASAWVVDDTVAAVPQSGNLYGSSKDVGTISAKLPTLSETGGRVNRVGFKRIEVEGSINKFGFFQEYTQESMDFDTDAERMQHINREMLNGAVEITEDALQIDLLNGAGVIRYGGDAGSDAEVSGETGAVSNPTYAGLTRLAIDLDNNRCPKNTRIITGTRMVDTKVVNAARYMYIGSELIPTVEKMTDNFGNQAFKSVEHYAAGTTVANGEIGSLGKFRVIVAPEMLHWAGAGAAVSSNAGYRETGGNYDIYPMLVVGDQSFTTIGFQTDGKSNKFKIFDKKPGLETADRNDPYGEIGFSSIKWYYGILLERPERIAVYKVVAEW